MRLLFMQRQMTTSSETSHTAVGQSDLYALDYLGDCDEVRYAQLTLWGIDALCQG